MLGPKGAAFLYVRRELQHLIDPLIVSWGYNSTPETTTGSRFIDLLQWTGTKDPTAALTIPTAIQFMQEYDWDEVRARCHELLHETIERICHLTELLPLYPLDANFYSQMAIAPLPLSNLALLKSRLYEEFNVEVPLIPWQGRNFVRVSIQAYNDRADVDALLKGLEALLPQVAI
jgi:isopenicillin-N epimerase